MNYLLKIIHNTNQNGVILLIIYSILKFVQLAPFQNACTNPGHTNFELTNPGQYKNIGQCKIWTGKKPLTLKPYKSWMQAPFQKILTLKNVLFFA